LKDSIQTCLEFRSLHDEIGLIPKEEYLKTIDSSDSSVSEHQQTLNRLYWELKQRKKLNESLNEMSRSMVEVKGKIAEKQAYLEGISGKLKEILEVSLLVILTNLL
uniref:THO complex subunit 7 homolog n=1 Tax=Mesocestoides corti TaxID=53468 RepID=A0A0R3U5L0_MESCO